MRLSPLGRTGLTVSELAFGGASVGQQYGPVSEADVRACLEHAAAAGMNLIDTSAYYGRGRSEELFGQVLTPELRRQFAICTKAGRLDRDRFDFSAAGMRACLEGSLRRLNCDAVDILLAHDIEFAADIGQVVTETAAILHQLKAEGKCRAIGMSGLPLSLLRTVIAQCQLDVVISYCHFTLFDRTLLTDLMPVAMAHGVGVLNASPLAMGLLTDAGPPPWNPADAEVRVVCQKAAAHCRDRGTDISTLGMQFCLAEPTIPATITGTAKLDELERNLATIGQRPDPMLLAEVEAILAPIRDRTWRNGNAD
jgi:L-galactose dehydrogenase